MLIVTSNQLYSQLIRSLLILNTLTTNLFAIFTWIDHPSTNFFCSYLPCALYIVMRNSSSCACHCRTKCQDRLWLFWNIQSIHKQSFDSLQLYIIQHVQIISMFECVSAHRWHTTIIIIPIIITTTAAAAVASFSICYSVCVCVFFASVQFRCKSGGKNVKNWFRLLKRPSKEREKSLRILKMHFLNGQTINKRLSLSLSLHLP